MSGLAIASQSILWAKNPQNGLISCQTSEIVAVPIVDQINKIENEFSYRMNFCNCIFHIVGNLNK